MKLTVNQRTNDQTANMNTQSNAWGVAETKFQTTTTTTSPLPSSTHSILQVTLSGPSLLLTVFGLIFSIYVFEPSFTASLIAVAPIPFIITNDFKAFLSLGPGGTPSTFTGYLKITYLRLFALSDPFAPPSIINPSSLCPQSGSFQSFSAWPPYREGPRPLIAGIAPQRQINQFGCPSIHQLLRAALINASDQNPALLRTGTSCFEKQGLALFAKHCMNRTCNGEICHVHASDKSLHMNLHPADAKVVLERKWGQRHPLARGGWLGRYVPKEFVLVYAPRNEQELEVVCKIIEAAAWWVMGRRTEILLGGGGVLDVDDTAASGDPANAHDGSISSSLSRPPLTCGTCKT